MNWQSWPIKLRVMVNIWMNLSTSPKNAHTTKRRCAASSAEPDPHTAHMPQCGAFQSRSAKFSGPRQNCYEAWFVACPELTTRLVTLLDQWWELKSSEDDSPSVCALTQEAQDARLNSLVEIAMTPAADADTDRHQRREWLALRLLTSVDSGSAPDCFVRVLDAFCAHLPWAHLGLIDKMVQNRRTRAESNAEQPAVNETVISNNAYIISVRILWATKSRRDGSLTYWKRRDGTKMTWITWHGLLRPQWLLSGRPS